VAEHETIRAPRTNIGLPRNERYSKRLRRPPSLEQLRLGPGLEHDVRRAVEGSRDRFPVTSPESILQFAPPAIDDLHSSWPPSSCRNSAQRHARCDRSTASEFIVLIAPNRPEFRASASFWLWVRAADAHLVQIAFELFTAVQAHYVALAMANREESAASLMGEARHYHGPAVRISGSFPSWRPPRAGCGPTSFSVSETRTILHEDGEYPDIRALRRFTSCSKRALSSVAPQQGVQANRLVTGWGHGTVVRRARKMRFPKTMGKEMSRVAFCGKGIGVFCGAGSFGSACAPGRWVGTLVARGHLLRNVGEM
jgi:hypothetical protein